MKQKVLLLMVLALGMCSINGSAQRRELKTEKNGYQWYQIKSEGGMRAEGAEGKNGSTLIPLSRGYDYIMFSPGKKMLGYFYVRRGHKEGVCDITGQEIIAPNKYDRVYFHEVDGHVGYCTIEINGAYGVCDITGKDIIPCRYPYPFVYDDNDGFRSSFKNNNSEMEFFTIDIKLDKQGKAYGSSIASSSSPSSSSSDSSQSPSNSSSSTNSSNNNSSGNETTTVVVEHHRDPIPVQQWQACFACGGMGTMGCDNCGGGGTKYIGDRLHRCSRCNGRGIIPCNVCYGNKGQYVTVYQ